MNVTDLCYTDDPEPDGGRAKQGESGTGCCTTSSCSKNKGKPTSSFSLSLDLVLTFITEESTIDSCCASKPAGKSAPIEEASNDTHDGCCAGEPIILRVYITCLFTYNNCLR